MLLSKLTKIIITVSFDFGVSIPSYNFSRASVHPQHLWKYLTRCNSYRMLGHKAVCSDLICSRDELQADGRIVTTPQPDSVEVFKDTNNKFRLNKIVPVGSHSLFDLNKGFRVVEPETPEEGMLPRAKVGLPEEQYESIFHEKLLDFKQTCFDVYDGLFDVSHWQSGATFNVEHKFDSDRIATCCFADMMNLACNNDKQVLCNKILDTVWGDQANMATQVNR